jgi:hypothetical protein
MIENVHIAMTNSFNIIVLGYDLEDIMSQRNNFLAHNPLKRYPSMRDLKNILEYFINQEDYHKCAALQKYIEKNQTP